MGIVYFSDTLIYTNLCIDSAVDRRYGKGKKPKGVNGFQTYFVDISET